MRHRTPMTLAIALLTLTALALGAPGLGNANEPDTAAELFDRFKALEGNWQSSSTAGWDEITSFEVIADGSVVMESTTFKDAPEKKMVTMFYLDAEELVAVHYCEARNQPRLRAVEMNPDDGTVTFEFDGGGNLPTRDHGHMDAAFYRFLDADQFVSRWSWYQEGQQQWFEDIDYRRVD